MLRRDEADATPVPDLDGIRADTWFQAASAEGGERGCEGSIRRAGVPTKKWLLGQDSNLQPPD